jgi:molybdopterin synthase catalytic subunit/GNAT superfamily N-acetyltransferase
MIIRALQPPDREAWRKMRLRLWPHYGEAVIDREIVEYGKRGMPETVFVAQRDDGGLCGFAEVSLRPFADGCRSTPVGYLEGWYVEPEHRRQGVGRALVRAGEDWARQQGCVEMASDCETPNHVSAMAHHRLGYSSPDKCTLLRKPLTSGPIAGQDDFIAIVPYKLWVGTAAKLVTDPRAGGIDIFLGTTRAETSESTARELLALDYEAYEQMALQQMRQLAQQARQRWPIVKLAMLHRVGRVALGEPSVIIAVASPHRAESFEACQFLIDALKKDVAIWKKEVWADGSQTWVHPSDPPPV